MGEHSRYGKQAAPFSKGPTTKLPSARTIRRACSKELYRTVKRLKLYIAPELMKQGEDMYFRKVIANLVWVTEHQDNRKAQCDWWDQEVLPELSVLWNVPEAKLSAAFRDAYGG
ncbi:hypothetical protein M3231_25795 [Neobacillus mesonae]|nr:hypothetical protein [Neobacillus mesonae]